MLVFNKKGLKKDYATDFPRKFYENARAVKFWTTATILTKFDRNFLNSQLSLH